MFCPIVLLIRVVELFGTENFELRDSLFAKLLAVFDGKPGDSAPDAI
jgi:hypothetical protein